MMNRREAIARVAWLLGGTITGAGIFIQGCGPADATADVSTLFLPDQIKFLDQVANTILPQTATPGAKEAHVGNFMAVMVRDCYAPEEQKTFLDGIVQLNQYASKKQGHAFMALETKQCTALLIELDAAQKEYQLHKKADDPNHYFRMMKELTLLGYFTSEIGCTQALRYLPVPGKYDGNISYQKGDKAWAST